MAKLITPSKQKFAERVRTLRAQKDVTATTLAKQMEVSPASVWQWENSGTVPREATLSKLATALGVTSSFLLNGHAPETATIGTPVKLSQPSLSEIGLEDLIRAIEMRGFKVSIKSL